MSKIADAVREEVIAAIREDRLQLPTLPEVALQVREAAEQEEISAAGLAAVIDCDPGLSVRVIKVANSPLYRGTRTLDTVASAVSRLGIKQSASLVTGFAMQGMFQATNEIIDKKMRLVWSQATQVAAICGVLARNFTRLKIDQALLAGLTHNIGALPVLTFAEDNDGFIVDSFTLDAVIDELHGELGALILHNWQFSEELAAVPATYTRYDYGSHPTNYIDVVMVAHLQRYAGTNHPCAKLDWSRIQAFHNLGLDPGVEVTQMEGVSEEIEHAKQALA